MCTKSQKPKENVQVATPDNYRSHLNSGLNEYMPSFLERITLHMTGILFVFWTGFFTPIF